jgi:hypothetical protein
VIVDEEAICVITHDGANTVARGQIRSIWEKKDGLYLSKRKGVFRHFGYVWIARDLNEYGVLKQLVAGWAHSDAAQG